MDIITAAKKASFNITQIKWHFSSASAIWDKIDTEAQQALLDYRNGVGSVPHCILLGLYATSDLADLSKLNPADIKDASAPHSETERDNSEKSCIKNPLNDNDYDGDDQIDDLKCMVRDLNALYQRMIGNEISVNGHPLLENATEELKQAVIEAGGFEIVPALRIPEANGFCWWHEGSATRSDETYLSDGDALNACFEMIAEHVNKTVSDTDCDTDEYADWNDMNSSQQIEKVRELYNVDCPSSVDRQGYKQSSPTM